MKMKFARVIAAAMLLSFTVQGCYGPFNLTRKLHNWNGSFENEWVDEAVFLGLIILPVYGISAFVDALVFNSIEFWGGENPIEVGQHVEESEDYRVVSQRVSDQQIDLQILRDGQVVADFRIRNDGEVTYAETPKGVRLGTVERLADGGLRLRDPEGRVVTLPS